MILAITFASLAAAALWEFLRPRRPLDFPALRRRLGNLAIWLFNIIFAALIFARPDTLRAPWPIADRWWSFVAGFVLLDAMSYGVHRLQHAVPVLWRFHALHHSDPDIDSTTSVRHHPIEFLSTSAVFWLAVVLIGIPVAVAAAHGTAVFVLAVLTHANTRWPQWLERIARPVIVTLDIHLVHHSAAPADADRNFGAVFSFFDRVFGTYRTPREITAFGVRELSRADACRPLLMLATPWRIGGSP